MTEQGHMGDLVSICEPKNAMQSVQETIAATEGMLRLVFSVTMCNYMVNVQTHSSELKLNGETLEKTKHFKYLETIFTIHDMRLREIQDSTLRKAVTWLAL